MNRDRDTEGRPHNARPRDALGRPLPRDQHQDADAPVIPDRIDPAEAVQLADRLLAEGRPFHAHEALEAAWKSGPAADRDLWQGLAQIAVGITHARRGNATGAVTLLRRGAQRAGRHHGDTHGIDLDRFRHAASELADQIEAAGLSGVAPELLSPRLKADGR